MPFHAVFTTWLGATFGQIDLFRIWKELLLVPLAIISLIIIYKDSHLKKWFFHSPLVGLILLYALLHLALGLIAYEKKQVDASALIYGLLINLRFLAFFLVCYVVASKVPWLKNNWRSLLIWPALIVISFGLLQLFVLPANFLTHVGYGPKTIPAVHTVDQKLDYMRLQSTLRGPNPLGAYLILIISTIAMLLIKEKYGRKYWAFIFTLATIILFFSYSRSAWLGAFLSVGLIFYWTIHNQKLRGWLMSGGIIIVVVLGSTVVVLRNNNIVQNTLFHTDETSRASESSNAARSQALIEGVKSVWHEPLGRGPGTAGPASFRNNHYPRIAENYYIQVAQEVGVVGLIIFITINVLIFRRLWQKRSDQLAVILLASIIGLTLVNIISHAWADDTIALVWFGLAGVAIGTDIIKRTQHDV